MAIQRLSGTTSTSRPCLVLQGRSMQVRVLHQARSPRQVLVDHLGDTMGQGSGGKMIAVHVRLDCCATQTPTDRSSEATALADGIISWKHEYRGLLLGMVQQPREEVLSLLAGSPEGGQQRLHLGDCISTVRHMVSVGLPLELPCR